MKFRTLAASAAAAVAAVCSLVVPVQPAAAASPIIIVDHNVAKSWDAIQATVSKAVELGAEGITMQEVCVTQANEMDGYWAGRWTVNWSVSKKDGCGPGNDVGTVAIWTGGGNGVDQDLVLPQDGTTPGDDYETRNPHLTCVKYGSTPVRHVCSAHLVAHDVEGVRGAQTRAIKNYTAEWISNQHFVVVGGDFNTAPTSPAMDSMYAQNGNGNFVEANQIEDGTRTGNLATHAVGKLDYVFFSTNRTVFPGGGGIQLFSTASDHKMVVARATVTA
ncbi:endonuclease/exonuclease/phosphatase family protein [Phycicoccus sonneratiae]|uniref:Endonuclease/exonuclease/phosphatase family protein n=1 Tax=Phycicoccus sonneratiae TaxID=2807628 RepID=A0ABS2CJU3_9MICO|nr:endonuclease/exonuclease/phosphatase family protein [Phycicoccus sonneraticus]MBM6400065.1 endonuclease/exonuclease/phosphatase family protein [Phycicoccus sonneraticus]